MKNMKSWTGMSLAAVLAVAWTHGAWAQSDVAKTAPTRVTIYTKDKSPATLKLQELPLKDGVSQYGITWTFEKPAHVGQFINEDWYVVGPVTVLKIDPAPRYGNEVSDDELDGREKSWLTSAAAMARCSTCRPGRKWPGIRAS